MTVGTTSPANQNHYKPFGNRLKIETALVDTPMANKGKSPVERGDFLSVRPSFHPSVHPSVRPSIHPSVRLSICPSFCLSPTAPEKGYPNIFWGAQDICKFYVF